MQFQDSDKPQEQNASLAYPVNLGSFDLNDKGQMIKTQTLQNSFHSCSIEGSRYFLNLYPQQNNTDFIIFSTLNYLPFTAQDQTKRFKILKIIDTLKANNVNAFGIVNQNEIAFRMKGSVDGTFMLHDLAFIMTNIYRKYRNIIHLLKRSTL
ncbi:MAG: hypothetical protein KBE16_06950 [Alphaproteobacteria bacterium]|nr:hypothetical protein [Alphaproteobacteria bacterium]MBP9877592.1 hypothetical protein [Alphaproteobacteria bacterium]